jgi:hypothetical protein
MVLPYIKCEVAKKAKIINEIEAIKAFLALIHDFTLVGNKDTKALSAVTKTIIQHEVNPDACTIHIFIEHPKDQDCVFISKATLNV